MKCPAEKAAGYTAVTFVVAIVLSWLISFAVGGIIGVGSTSAVGVRPASATRVRWWLRRRQPHGQAGVHGTAGRGGGHEDEAAQKSGDVNAQREAAGDIMSAVAGGETRSNHWHPTDQPFVPESLAGLKRTEISAERNNAMGVQVSEDAGRTRTIQGVPCASRSSTWAA